jgi:serine/threonine protein kinase
MFCSRCGAEVQNGAKFCPSCGLDLAATTPIAAVGQPVEESEKDVVGNALKGEYEIVQELGRGGMAIVYKARERELEREVAIKVLPFSLGFDAEFVERFQREARTAAKLEHPNIIPIYRVGKSGRVIYFVMKMLRGESLSEVLERGGPVPPKEIRRILAQTAAALGYAHKNGIVHRDIKPDNIMFDESGHAIVTDFGIAKAATGTRLTGTGMSIGTPHYMSPEQARAQPLDGRSDVYSLGVVAYQCLTGSVPFDGEDSFAIGYKHIMEDLPEPDLPTAEHRSLFDVIRRMMAKSPDDRFQSAEELVAVLEGSAPLRMRGAAEATISTAPTTSVPLRPPMIPTGARDVSPSTPTTPIPGAVKEPLEDETKEETGERKKRGGMLVGLLAFLLVGGGGVGGYWYFFLDAQWPLPFMSGGRSTTVALADSSAGDSTITDSLLALAGDSVPASDSLASDSAASDTTSATDRPNTGTLVVRDVPEGARLKVNDELVEGDSLELEAGSHKVEVERAGYEKYQDLVPVGRGERVILPIPPLVRIEEDEPEPVRPPPPPVDVCARDLPAADYFQPGRCYDSAPSATTAPIMSVNPGTDTAPQVVPLLVKVGTDGRPVQVLPGRRARTDRFTLAARLFARDSLLYSPALKGGQPIEAWLRVNVRLRPQP